MTELDRLLEITEKLSKGVFEDALEWKALREEQKQLKAELEKAEEFSKNYGNDKEYALYLNSFVRNLEQIEEGLKVFLRRWNSETFSDEEFKEFLLLQLTQVLTGKSYGKNSYWKQKLQSILEAKA